MTTRRRNGAEQLVHRAIELCLCRSGSALALAGRRERQRSYPSAVLPGQVYSRSEWAVRRGSPSLAVADSVRIRLRQNVGGDSWMPGWVATFAILSPPNQGRVGVRSRALLDRPTGQSSRGGLPW